jgi:hypothetical protein
MLTAQQMPAENLTQPPSAIDLRSECGARANVVNEIVQSIVERAHHQRFRKNFRVVADGEPRKGAFAQRSSVSQMAKEEFLCFFAFHRLGFA